jgi:hypothetical protein
VVRKLFPGTFPSERMLAQGFGGRNRGKSLGVGVVFRLGGCKLREKTEQE